MIVPFNQSINNWLEKNFIACFFFTLVGPGTLTFQELKGNLGLFLHVLYVDIESNLRFKAASTLIENYLIVSQLDSSTISPTGGPRIHSPIAQPLCPILTPTIL